MNTSTLTRSAKWMLLAAAIGTATATPEPGPSGDESIADFIAMDVKGDQRMVGSKVEVSTENGIATLTGKALSLDQSERAAASALTIDGVRAVINQIDIMDPVASDATLAERTMERLRESKALDSSRINVIVDGRRGVLLGKVGSWDEQELAREIATETIGLNEIDNRLEVTFDTLRTDPAIQAQIVYQVNDDPLYQGIDVNVEVNEGVVRLAGQVGSTSEKDQLINQSYVTGVTQVWADDIMINTDLAMEGMGGKVPTEDATLAAFNDAISDDPRLKRADIRAEVDEKVITLTGTAPNIDSKAAAESTARGLAGSWIINNEIQVTNHTARNDKTEQFASNGPQP